MTMTKTTMTSLTIVTLLFLSNITLTLGIQPNAIIDVYHHNDNDNSDNSDNSDNNTGAYNTFHAASYNASQIMGAIFDHSHYYYYYLSPFRHRFYKQNPLPFGKPNLKKKKKNDVKELVLPPLDDPFLCHTDYYHSLYKTNGTGTGTNSVYSDFTPSSPVHTNNTNTSIILSTATTTTTTFQDKVILLPKGNYLVTNTTNTTTTTTTTSTDNNNNNNIYIPPICSISTQAQNAQLLGASGIIFYNTLSSYYSYNRVNHTIIMPRERLDYECQHGKSWIPKDYLVLDPFYDGMLNDPLLTIESGGGSDEGSSNSSSSSNNVDASTTTMYDGDYNKITWNETCQVGNECQSQRCVITGETKTYKQVPILGHDLELMQLCCAWDKYRDFQSRDVANVDVAYTSGGYGSIHSNSISGGGYGADDYGYYHNGYGYVHGPSDGTYGHYYNHNDVQSSPIRIPIVYMTMEDGDALVKLVKETNMNSSGDITSTSNDSNKIHVVMYQRYYMKNNISSFIIWMVAVLTVWYASWASAENIRKTNFLLKNTAIFQSSHYTLPVQTSPQQPAQSSPQQPAQSSQQQPAQSTQSQLLIEESNEERQDTDNDRHQVNELNQINHTSPVNHRTTVCSSDDGGNNDQTPELSIPQIEMTPLHSTTLVETNDPMAESHETNRNNNTNVETVVASNVVSTSNQNNDTIQSTNNDHPIDTIRVRGTETNTTYADEIVVVPHVDNNLHYEDGISGGYYFATANQSNSMEERFDIDDDYEEYDESRFIRTAILVVVSSLLLLVLFFARLYVFSRVIYSVITVFVTTKVFVYPMYRLIAKILRLENYINSFICRRCLCYNIIWLDIISILSGATYGIYWIYFGFVKGAANHAFYWITKDFVNVCSIIFVIKKVKMAGIKSITFFLIICMFSDVIANCLVDLSISLFYDPLYDVVDFCEKYPNDRICLFKSLPLPGFLSIPNWYDFRGKSAILGVFDLIVPGLLLSFGARLDASKKLMSTFALRRRAARRGITTDVHEFMENATRQKSRLKRLFSGYFVWLVISYSVALLVAVFALPLIMNGHQRPVFLFVTPTLVGTITYLDYRRKKMIHIWEYYEVLDMATRVIELCDFLGPGQVGFVPVNGNGDDYTVSEGSSIASLGDIEECGNE